MNNMAVDGKKYVNLEDLNAAFNATGIKPSEFNTIKRKTYNIKNHDGTDDGTNEAFDTWNGRAVRDGDGNVITSTYFKLADKNTKADTSYVNNLETYINNMEGVFNGKIRAIKLGSRADGTDDTWTGKANKDGNGNVIADTYVTKSSADSTYFKLADKNTKADTSYVNNLEKTVNNLNVKTQHIMSIDRITTTGEDAYNEFNGLADKARKDEDGNSIKDTYVKKSELTSGIIEYTPASYNTDNVSECNIKFSKIGNRVFMSGTITFSNISLGSSTPIKTVSARVEIPAECVPSGLNSDTYITVGGTVTGINYYALFARVTSNNNLEFIGNIELNKQYFVQATWETE